MENKNLAKQAKDLLDHHIALVMDRADWNHAYGLIDMAEGLGLLSTSEARDYRSAADAKRTPRNAQSDFSDRMAVAEAHRKNGGCERMIYGDYFGNNIRCQTCLKDCDHTPVGKPSEKEIDSAKRAIDIFRNKESASNG